MKILLAVALIIAAGIVVAIPMIFLLKKQNKKTEIPQEVLDIMNLMNDKNNYSEEELKWNKMIDLWVENELNDPIKHLITYDNEIQNGGHLQFFENCQNELKSITSFLKKTLSKELNDNFKHAQNLYKKMCTEIEKDNFDEDKYLEKFEEFDNFYYENEEEVKEILENYANTLEL